MLVRPHAAGNAVRDNAESDLLMAVRDIQNPHSHPSNDLSLIAACSGRQNFFIYIFEACSEPWFVLSKRAKLHVDRDIGW